MSLLVIEMREKYFDDYSIILIAASVSTIYKKRLYSAKYIKYYSQLNIKVLEL